MNIHQFFGLDRRRKDYQKRRMFRAVGQDVIMNVPYIGIWAKNSQFELLEISDYASLTLYNRYSSQCIGLTDYAIAKECGSNMTEKQFADVCRASDLCLTDDKPKTFIEFITDTQGNPHIWKTVKSKVFIENETYYFGFATFLDVMLGSYEAAQLKFMSDSHDLIMINDNLFVYK